MDYDAGQEASVSFKNVSIDDSEVESCKVGNLESVTSDGVVIGELGKVGEVLTRVELDLACASEKLINLSVLTMHVGTKEGDFEAFASKEEATSVDSVEKALEFTLLSRILDSEVSELDQLMAVLQMDITGAQGILSSYTCLGESFAVVEEKLCDSERYLKQLQDQIYEIRMQSSKFLRTFLVSDGEENWNADRVICPEDDEISSMSVKINMQTVEHQRHILRMLEKALAREMDLEKKLIESKQIEEDLKLRLQSSEQEANFMEEEATDAWDRWLQADNASEVVMGISKELLAKIQILQLNLNGSVQRESELRSKLDGHALSRETTLQKLESSNAVLNSFLVDQTAGLKDSLKEAEDKLIIADSESFTLREKVSSLEEHHYVQCSEISDLENFITDLKAEVLKAEARAENAEAKIKLLTEANTELIEEIGCLKSIGNASETVDSLERKLKESDTQLQHAVASVEASQEKQNMLYYTITDMENVIEDLKQKVVKAESRTDSAEDKCILLSESHALLNEELSFLRSRLECLETSLHQAEEVKMATATDIGLRSKVLTNLVMQLAFERERLHKQISSLAMENKTLVLKLRTSNGPSVVVSSDDRVNDRDFMLSKNGPVTGTRGGKLEEADEMSDGNSKLDKAQKNVSVTYATETVRRIDAGVLRFKDFLIAMLILLIAAAAYFLLQPHCPF